MCARCGMSAFVLLQHLFRCNVGRPAQQSASTPGPPSQFTRESPLHYALHARPSGALRASLLGVQRYSDVARSFPRRPQPLRRFASLHSRRYCSFRRAVMFLRPNNSFNATVMCRADNPASLSGALTQALDRRNAMRIVLECPDRPEIVCVHQTGRCQP